MISAPLWATFRPVVRKWLGLIDILKISQEFLGESLINPVTSKKGRLLGADNNQNISHVVC